MHEDFTYYKKEGRHTSPATTRLTEDLLEKLKLVALVRMTQSHPFF